MNNLKNTKKIYDQITPPSHLTDMIQETINSIPSPSRKKYNFKPLITIGLSLSTIFIILINTSPVLAANLAEFPILNQLVKVLSFNSYEKSDISKKIYVRVPSLQNTGNSELENKINNEISKRIDSSITQSEEFAKELYNTYVEAGYKDSEIEPLLVKIDYTTTFYNERYLSFIITKYENIPYSTVVKEQYYYNLDLQTGKEITLQDLFGNDYLNKIDTDIKKQIELKENEDENTIFFDDVNSFKTIKNKERFYINADGQVVIVFDRYEIAPGYMGSPEFIINLPMELKLNES